MPINRVFIVALVLVPVLINAENFTLDKGFNGLQTSMSNKDLLMVVATISRPDDIDLPRELKHIYIVAFDSLLFLPPYMRYYTFLTITARMYFGTLTIDPAALPYYVNEMNTNTGAFYVSNQTTTPFIETFMNETNVLQATSTNGNLSICWIDPAKRYTYEIDFYCKSLSNTALPPFKVFYNEFIRWMDVTFLLFQTVVTIGIVYVYVRFMNLVRKSRKFIFVTDSIRNPPMWQCLLPLSTDTLVKFRIWDSMQLIFFHIIFCATTLISQVSPKDWPDANREWKKQWSAILHEREYYYAPLIVIIVINTILFILKLLSDNYRQHYVRIDKSNYGIKSKITRFVLTVVANAMVIGISALYLVFGVSSERDYRRGIWFSGVALFSIALFYNMYTMNIYVHRRLGNWIVSKTTQKSSLVSETDDRYVELNSRLTDDFSVEQIIQTTTSEKDALTVSPALHIMFIIVNYIIRAAWMSTLVIMAFSTGYVLSRFIESTITNVLINSDMITTYSYVFSIIGVLYKFLVDVETPYIKLKNLIAKERSALSMDRIVPYREFLTTITYDQVRDEMLVHNTYSYLIPMTWTVFMRISKLMRIKRMSSRSIMQMSFTIFILCVFYFASQIYNTQFSKAISGNSTLFAIIAGTVMPLLPKVVAYFTENEAGIDSQIYLVRLQNALRLLERQEEKRNTLEFTIGSIPHKWIPFRYTLLSAMHERKKEKMDPLYEYDEHTKEATIIQQDLQSRQKEIDQQ
jgi:hypothetical protein